MKKDVASKLVRLLLNSFCTVHVILPPVFVFVCEFVCMVWGTICYCLILSQCACQEPGSAMMQVKLQGEKNEIFRHLLSAVAMVNRRNQDSTNNGFFFVISSQLNTFSCSSPQILNRQVIKL